MCGKLSTNSLAHTGYFYIIHVLYTVDSRYTVKHRDLFPPCFNLNLFLVSIVSIFVNNKFFKLISPSTKIYLMDVFEKTSGEFKHYKKAARTLALRQ